MAAQCVGECRFRNYLAGSAEIGGGRKWKYSGHKTVPIVETVMRQASDNVETAFRFIIRLRRNANNRILLR